MDFEAVIGLEVHAQLATRSKIFCACSASFGAAPNENTGPVCTGMPGVLPVLNRKAVEYTIRTALLEHRFLIGEEKLAVELRHRLRADLFRTTFPLKFW